MCFLFTEATVTERPPQEPFSHLPSTADQTADYRVRVEIAHTFFTVSRLVKHPQYTKLSNTLLQRYKVLNSGAYITGFCEELSGLSTARILVHSAPKHFEG